MHPGRLLIALIVLGLSSPARAELVFFATGRTMSVKEHRMENGSLVLVLRSGGEVVCDPAVVARIGLDEAPYPEPPAAVLSEAPNTSARTAPTDEDAAVPFGDVIERVAAKEGVDPRLVRAVIHVESNYQSNARSPKGAMGLMQLMPETARSYALVNPYDPVANIEAGVKHLKSLLARYPRDLALAAYNAGAGAVERFHGIPPFRETISYVARVLQLADRS